MLKKNTACMLIIIMLSVNMTNGQTAATDVSAELERLYGRLAKNLTDSVKVSVNDSIKSIVESYVSSDTVFYHRFNKLRYLGQVTSPDTLLKIVTWNLVLKNRPGIYYCYIIKKQTGENRNLIYSLTAEYKESPVRSDTIFSADNWYGALYYDIRPFIINDRSSWVLLGIDYGNMLITRKVIDILDFTDDNNIKFGMKIFSLPDTLKYREVFEYSSVATMSLRFAGDSSIVFDHLVPFSPELSDDRQYYGPHFSTDAFFPGNGFWKFRLNVDARNNE